LRTFASSFVPVCTAADATPVPQAVVKYGDLNVSSPQGATRLYNRIASRAIEVCGGAVDIHDLARQTSVAACVHKSIADAVAEVGEAALTAVYQSTNGASASRRILAAR